MCCLVLGLLAGEVADISARSIDDEGRILRVDESKTDAGIRLVAGPEVLRPRKTKNALSARFNQRDMDIFFAALKLSQYRPEEIASRTRCACVDPRTGSCFRALGGDPKY